DRSTASSRCWTSAVSCIWTTPTGRSASTAGGFPGSTARRTCSRRSACGPVSGEGRGRPSRPRRSPRWSTSPGGRTGGRRGARLGPAELAAVVSSLVYESRREGLLAPQVPAGAVSEALDATWRLWTELEDDERRHKLERTREPDAGFAWPVFRWARGESLER